MTNCPNCGAPVIGAKCDYCGTVFQKNSSSDIPYNGELIKKKKILVSKAEKIFDKARQEDREQTKEEIEEIHLLSNWIRHINKISGEKNEQRHKNNMETN